MTEGYPTRRRHGEVVHDLGAQIVGGAVPPGATLPTEEKLAQQYAVSRGALREAVKVLAGKGLVASRTRAGTVVQPPERWNLMDPDVLGWQYQNDPTAEQLDDLAEIRNALEPEAARLAARNADAAAVQAICDAYDAMVAALADPDAFIAADLAFHAAVFRASDNPLFIHLNRMMALALAAVRQVHSRSRRRNRETLPDHAAVRDAIAAGDEPAAADLMRTLVLEAAHDVHKAARRTTSRSA